MTKQRLDIELTKQGLTTSRSQAESWVRLGKVTVDGKVVTKPGHFVQGDAVLNLTAKDQYVSRAGLKLASVAKLLHLDFKDKIVLDVGSSTGGFTDYALRGGAKKVFAVDVGTDQLHPSLQSNPLIELHEKTDVRDCYLINNEEGKRAARAADLLRARSDEKNRQVCLIDAVPDIIVIDVSFISLREILPHLAKNLSSKDTQIAAMLKPQFEAGKDQTNKGVIKNESVRRQILRGFETWAKRYFVITDKRDSDVHGARGNQERFYLLRVITLK